MRNPLRSVSRRDFLRASAAGGSVAALHLAGLAQPAGPRSDTGAEFITADTQAAIDRGLAQLALGQG
ncbi:MAG: twin-arginine translocation signal domain-containing protein, partial [Planctomycetes bacterium]|nr:twin-arginine translocation signal domain-containing protein [Planctomycetota bacterium]